MNNPSGIEPVEFNILVKQEEVAAKTKGGLLLSEETLEREKHSATRGEIIATSPMAFNEDVWPQGVTPPQPGDRVLFARHAGTFTKGEDGEEYRIIKDKDVVAVLSKAAVAQMEVVNG